MNLTRLSPHDIQYSLILFFMISINMNCLDPEKSFGLIDETRFLSDNSFMFNWSLEDNALDTIRISKPMDG